MRRPSKKDYRKPKQKFRQSSQSPKSDRSKSPVHLSSPESPASHANDPLFDEDPSFLDELSDASALPETPAAKKFQFELIEEENSVQYTQQTPFKTPMQRDHDFEEVGSVAESSASKSKAALGLKQSEKLIDELQKDNFGLKLRIYFLEESIKKASPNGFLQVQQENTDLHQNVQELKKELENYQHELDVAINESSESQQKFIVLEEGYSELERQNEANVAKIQVLETEIESRSKNEEEQRSRLLNELTELQQKYDTKQSTINKNQIQIKELSSRVEQLSSHVSDLQRQLTKANTDKQTLEKSNINQLSKLNETIKNQQTLIDQLRHEKLENLNEIKENNTFKQRIDQLEGVYEKYLNEQSRVHELIQQNESQTNEIYELRSKLASLAAEKQLKVETSQEGLVKIEVLHKELDAALHQISQLQTEKAVSQNQIGALNRSLTDSHSANDNLKTQLKSLKEKASQLQAENVQLQNVQHVSSNSENSELKSLLASAFNSIDGLKQEIQSQTATFKEMESKSRQDFAAKENMLQKKISVLEGIHVSLKKENSALEQQKKDFEAFLSKNSEKDMIAEISRLNDLLRNQNTETSEFELLVAQNRNLKTRIQDLEADNLKLVAENEAINIEFSRSTRADSKLQEQEKANKILQKAVIERSYLLSKVLTHLHSRLEPEAEFAKPDFNREYSASVARLKKYLELLQTMHENFKKQADTIQDQLVKEKNQFEKKLSVLSEKVVSFENIIRQAAKNQARLREQRNAFRAKYENAAQVVDSLKQNLNEKTRHEIVGKAENESEIQVASMALEQLREQLTLAEQQLQLERTGASDRVRELLELNKTLEQKCDYWKRRYESIDKKEGTLKRSLSQEKYNELRQLNQKLRNELQEKISQIERTEQEYSSVRKYCKSLQKKSGDNYQYSSPRKYIESEYRSIEEMLASADI